MRFSGGAPRADRAPLLSFPAKRPRPGELLVLLASLVFLLATGRSGYAGTASFTVSATVLSKSNCKFDTKSAVLSFGALDPGNAVDVDATATIGFRCMGSAPIATFAISAGDGLNGTGPGGHRMRHASLPATFLPYDLVLSPTSASVPKNDAQTLTITGTVPGIEYRNADAGSYTDTVVIRIDP